ncbi:MAG: hypothetical protein QM651_16965 [Rhodoblastus sp.]
MTSTNHETMKPLWADFDRHELLLLLDEFRNENPLARCDAIMCARARWNAASARSAAAGRLLACAVDALTAAGKGRSVSVKEAAEIAYRRASRAAIAAYETEEKRWSALDALYKAERA